MINIPTEIEQKWLIDKDKFNRKVNKREIKIIDEIKIKQNYISVRDNKELRIRCKKRKQDSHWHKRLTVKEYIKNNIKEEKNKNISEDKLVNFLMDYSGKPIIKNRYRVSLKTNSNYKNCIVDVFQQPSSGCNIAEVEFDSKEDLNFFMKPSWFDIELHLDNRDIWERLNSSSI